jgi:hypothetical protein
MVAPLTFSIPAGKEPAQQLSELLNVWGRAYEAEIERVGKRVVSTRPIDNDSGAPGEVLVRADVVSLVRFDELQPEDRAGATGDDHIEAVVTFTDSESKRELLSLRVRTSSNRSGAENWTTRGRIEGACKNLADAVVRAMMRGKL